MPSSVAAHAPPSFYAVYLLRSMATPSSTRTYIGSSPDPARRKRQHNGELTAGAHKTRNGRPWETQLIVWGFGSKIAALQFEWAWQKPHLSRHLRTTPDSSAGASSTSAPFVPQPLFPSSSRTTTAPMANGKRHLGANTPQAQLLVLRALLQSEPYAAWGLRVTFFEEWAWSAWQRLPVPATCSRGGRDMPDAALLPPTTDFRGVDGLKRPLLALPPDAKKALKLEGTKEASKGKGKGKAKVDDTLATLPGHWPEALPRVATARAMGATWDSLEAAPCPPPSLLPETETGEGSEAQQREASDRPRFRCDDDELAKVAYARLVAFLASRGISEADFLKGSQVPAPPAHRGERAPCSSCGQEIQLWDHLSYALCPSPLTELLPRAPSAAKTSLVASLSGATEDYTASAFAPRAASKHCHAIFHVECLAKAWSTPSSPSFLLPTHGVCPSCPPAQAKPALWSDVIRATFRRREVAESIVVARAKAALKEARALARAPKGKRKKAAASSPPESDESESEPEGTLGLLASLDRLTEKAKTKRKKKDTTNAVGAAEGSARGALAATAPRAFQRVTSSSSAYSFTSEPSPPPHFASQDEPSCAQPSSRHARSGLLGSLDALTNVRISEPAASKQAASSKSTAERPRPRPKAQAQPQAQASTSAQKSRPTEMDFEIIDLT